MKRVLFGFFQVLCVLQLFGAYQVNAHSNAKFLTAAETTHLQTDRLNFSKIPTSTIDKIPDGIELVRFFNENENLDETETELDSSSKKQDGSNHYFITSFCLKSPEYLSCNGKNSLAFCKKLAFTPTTQRHLLFQIFRI